MRLAFRVVRWLRVSSLSNRSGPRPWFLQTGVVSSGGKGLQSHRLTLLVTTVLQARIAPVTEKSDFTWIQEETVSLTSYVLLLLTQRFWETPCMLSLVAPLNLKAERWASVQ